MPQTGQRVRQRSMHPGPLVTKSPITRGVDYIFSPHLDLGLNHILDFLCGGRRIILQYESKNLPFRVSRYGVKSDGSDNRMDRT